MDSDDVVDYMVLEAVAIKVGKDDADARKQQEIDKWKQDRISDLEAYR